MPGEPPPPAAGAPDAGIFCRDCLKPDARGSLAGRCRHCGGPRIVDHPEWRALAIAHVDCDAFYASIEKRDDPSLRDRPVIVGGGRRGVVATCCYVARTYGVRSAMPMFKALRACPDAVVIRPDMEKYARVGREVRALMLELTPLVEPISIDEAFLDLSGTEILHAAPPALTLARFATRVERELGISVSIGLSCNKFLAKIASDLAKPRGFSVIGRADAVAFLSDRSVGILPGVGPAARGKLERAGIRLVGDIARTDLRSLAGLVGSDATRLAALARAIDDRPVRPESETRSVSAETTFETDETDPETLAATLLRLSEKVARRLKAKELSGRTVTLKLKTADFRLLTRSRTLPHSTALARRIFEVAHALLAREATGTAFRLAGVGVSELAPLDEADPGDLADTGAARERAMETAVEALRDRFGTQAVVRGRVFAGSRNPGQRSQGEGSGKSSVLSSPDKTKSP
jgi:DNA polymerase-4